MQVAAVDRNLHRMRCEDITTEKPQPRAEKLVFSVDLHDAAQQGVSDENIPDDNGDQRMRPTEEEFGFQVYTLGF